MNHPTNLQKHSEGRFERLHHEAGAHARAANAAAGVAAHRLARGDLDGARGARVLSAWHRSRIAACRAMLHDALVDVLAGEDLETRYVRREVPA